MCEYNVRIFNISMEDVDLNSKQLSLCNLYIYIYISNRISAMVCIHSMYYIPIYGCMHERVYLILISVYLHLPMYMFLYASHTM